MDHEWLAEIEGDAAMLLARARVEDDDEINVGLLCRRITGFAPWLSRSVSRVAWWEGHHHVVINRLLPVPRARWVICHEIAEWHYLQTGYRAPDIEKRCDALGAALVLPRRLLRRATRTLGHRVHTLSKELDLTQALVMLRLGEVENRPVLFERKPGLLVSRGAPFEWPKNPNQLPRSVAHPIRLPDEQRWGWMAA